MWWLGARPSTAVGNWVCTYWSRGRHASRSLGFANELAAETEGGDCMSKRFKLLSLFSGCGAADLGMEQAGWDIECQVEIDKFCRTILQRHWPKVPKHDDI